MKKEKQTHAFEIIIIALAIISEITGYGVLNWSIMVLIVYVIWLLKDLINTINKS